MNELDTIMNKEKLSALMDGEFDPKELDALLAALNQDDALLQEWQEWQLASDALHGDLVSDGFMSRFSERLAAEPVVLAPRRLLRQRVPVRRLLVPLTVAASVAFVGVAMWRVNQPVQETTAAQIAAETETTLRSYLAAHRETDGNPFAEGDVIQANFQPAEVR